MTKAKPQKKNPPFSAKSNVSNNDDPTVDETDIETKKGGVRIPEPHPTEELLLLAIAAWRMSLLQPIFYFMTRTFAHYRKGEKYDSAIVFDRLRDLPIALGKHDQHVQEIDDYIGMLQAEIKPYLARHKDK